ncbi:tyrosine-type recombinase/integrase [Sporosarcina newyorkensis]|uniref:tyrosine-type recombinase/integrase n=1 Tax=Sporosarcina newyorkensis TaxID=759851 RepID=UPI003CFF2E20
MRENPVEYQRGKEVMYWKLKTPLSNTENEERINDYLLSLYVGNYSKFTVQSYRGILQNFFREKEEIYSSIESSKIQKWLTELLTNCTEGTVAFRISVLNSFYQFCIEEGYMEKSPMKKRWYPRLPHAVPKYLEKREVVKVRRLIEEDNIRNRALVEFLLTSGCRVGEVHRLDRSDVDMERRTAMVIGKGQKIRQINFSESCAILLERYLESRSDQHPALFVTNHWSPRRLSTKWMGTILNRIGTRAELSSSLHPHRLRHTFATDLLEKGADLSFIGEELGHANLKTTQVYANLPKQKIKLLYRRYMG